MMGGLRGSPVWGRFRPGKGLTLGDTFLTFCFLLFPRWWEAVVKKVNGSTASLYFPGLLSVLCPLSA